MLGTIETRRCFIGDARFHISVIGNVGKRLKQEMTRLISHGVTHFVCAAEAGLNSIAAAMAVVLKNDCPDITLTFVLPSEEYTVFGSKREQDFFAGISREADEILYASEYPSGQSAQICERQIIDSAMYCICHAKNQSKAKRAVEYARDNGKIIVDLTL